MSRNRSDIIFLLNTKIQLTHTTLCPLTLLSSFEKTGLLILAFKCDIYGHVFSRPWYCWCLIVQQAKIRYGWAFLQLKMLKYGTAEVSFHWKCWYKVQPVCFIVKKAKLKYAWCSLPLKMWPKKFLGGSSIENAEIKC